jgi:hypothetical protein
MLPVLLCAELRSCVIDFVPFLGPTQFCHNKASTILKNTLFCVQFLLPLPIMWV